MGKMGIKEKETTKTRGGTIQNQVRVRYSRRISRQPWFGRSSCFTETWRRSDEAEREKVDVGMPRGEGRMRLKEIIILNMTGD